ncbi:MAG: lipoprotein insertase outer membrane protein LolB [Motiliproteus sp.]
MLNLQSLHHPVLRRKKLPLRSTITNFSLFVVLLIGLMGCSSQPQQPTEPLAKISWEQRQQQLLPLTRWQVLGKINIRTPQENNTASLNWSQFDDRYRIYMAGPLGQGAVNISGSEQHGIILDISGEDRRQAASPEQLLNQRLGWSIPVSQMPYWIRGLPAPNRLHAKTLDPFNRLQQLQQNGWTIDYLSYQQQQQQQHLPRKIQLQRGAEMKLTLILKEWQFSSTTNPAQLTPL